MTYEDYLQHWGILGMKWGQRNGPPYPLGSSQMNSKEKRLFSKTKGTRDKTPEEVDAEIARINKKQAIKNAKMDAKIAAINKKQEYADAKKRLRETEKEERVKELDANKLRRKNPKKLSEEELNVVIARLNKEKQIREMNAASVKNGSKFVTGLLATGGTIALTTFVSNLAKKWGDNTSNNVWNNLFDKKGKEAKNAYSKAFEEARKEAKDTYGKSNKDPETAEEFKKFIDYATQYVNFQMTSMGFDKPYKKDK